MSDWHKTINLLSIPIVLLSFAITWLTRDSGFFSLGITITYCLALLMLYVNIREPIMEYIKNGINLAGLQADAMGARRLKLINYSMFVVMLVVCAIILAFVFVYMHQQLLWAVILVIYAVFLGIFFNITLTAYFIAGERYVSIRNAIIIIVSVSILCGIIWVLLRTLFVFLSLTVIAFTLLLFIGPHILRTINIVKNIKNKTTDPRLDMVVRICNYAAIAAFIGSIFVPRNIPILYSLAVLVIQFVIVVNLLKASWDAS